MSLGYELAELINDASRLSGGTIDNDRIVLTADEIPSITSAKITDIGDYATVVALNLKADTSYVNNQVADKATITYVDNKVNNEIQALVNSAPSTLDTLNELAAALGDDPSFATSISTQLGNKADTTYVDAQLATKANTTAMNNALDLKADITYVDNGLADKLEQDDLANYVTSTTLNNEVSTLNTSINGKVDATYVSTQLATYATRTYVDTEIDAVVAGQSNLSKTKMFIASSGQTSFGPFDHTSGNIDIWLNGVRLLNQITDSSDTDGSENLTDNTIYDYQSQIASYVGDVLQANTQTTLTNAGDSANTIKLVQAPSDGSKLVIRSY